MKLSKYTLFHKHENKIYIYHQVSNALFEIDNELVNALKAHPINSGERKKKILSLHHGKFNVRVFGKLHAAIQYIISFYNSKSRK